MEENKQFDKDDLFERAKDYINTSIELKKLTVTQAVVKTVSSLASGLILLLVGLFFIAFLSVTAALYFGQLLASNYLGFLIVALFYLLIGLLVLAMRKNYIQNPIVDVLIRKILKKEE
ncbi:MAG TPA: phage holin family protein [Pelobium sp.]